MPPRKYFSEVTLGLNTRNALAIPPDQLMSGKPLPLEAKDVIENCHIYAICRRPGLAFDPNSLKYDGVHASGLLVRRIDGSPEKHLFQFRLEVEKGRTLSISDYPHRMIVAPCLQGNRDEDIVWPASIVSMRSELQDRSINDFEVLYVGQAFADGKRTAFERLQSHQTLQKILAETMASNPDDEVLLFLFEYEPAKAFVKMDGTTTSDISGDEDMQHIRSVLDNPPSQKEEISIAEAGLIWYFQPEFNIKLKDSYPHEKLKLLSSCYNFDLCGLIVEINTEEFPVRLYSKVRPAGHHHIAQYDLHDPNLRRTFFSLDNQDGSLTLMDLSGPSY